MGSKERVTTGLTGPVAAEGMPMIQAMQAPKRFESWLQRMAEDVTARTLGLADDAPRSSLQTRPAKRLTETVKMTVSAMIADGLMLSEVSLVIAAGLSGGMEGFVKAGMELCGRIAPKRQRTPAPVTDLRERIAKAIAGPEGLGVDAAGQEEEKGEGGNGGDATAA